MKVYSHLGTAGKCTPKEAAELRAFTGQIPRFGRCWFYWLPSFRWNGGRLLQYQVVDLSASWGMWWISLTLYPTCHMRQQQASCCAANVTQSPSPTPERSTHE